MPLRSPLSRVARLALPTLLALAALPVGTRARADNHFIAEATAGLAVPMGGTADDTPGLGFGATLGVGGKIKGLSPAWYLVGRLGYAGATQTGPASLGAAEISRAAWEAALGGRVYLNITERLRGLIELAFGEVWESSEVTRAGHPGLQFQTNPVAVFVGTGVQYRLTDHLAVGGGVDLVGHVTGTSEDLAFLAAGVEGADDTRGRVRFALTSTFHF